MNVTVYHGGYYRPLSNYNPTFVGWTGSVQENLLNPYDYEK